MESMWSILGRMLVVLVAREEEGSTCESVSEDELFRRTELFRGCGFRYGQLGGVDAGEFGNCVFFRLDAVCSSTLPGWEL